MNARTPIRLSRVGALWGVTLVACSVADEGSSAEADNDASSLPAMDAGAPDANSDAAASSDAAVCGRSAPTPFTTATCTTPADDGNDLHGVDRCRPIPTRMVALGDSIAECVLSSQSCAPALIADYLRTRYAPDLSYQSYARSGARTVELPGQATRVAPCPGHLLVWIYIGGNDLANCQVPDLEEARSCVDDLVRRVPQQWRFMFDYFSDRASFPDGVTFILNTQYSLSDTCRNPFDRAAFAEEQIMRFNQVAEIDPAEARDDTVAVDQFPDWLGHARAAGDSTCPHYDANDAASWLSFDGTHPNELGQCQIASKGKAALDRMYDCAP